MSIRTPSIPLIERFSSTFERLERGVQFLFPIDIGWIFPEGGIFILLANESRARPTSEARARIYRKQKQTKKYIRTYGGNFFFDDDAVRNRDESRSRERERGMRDENGARREVGERRRWQSR